MATTTSHPHPLISATIASLVLLTVLLSVSSSRVASASAAAAAAANIEVEQSQLQKMKSDALQIATEEMQKANYFTFVMLINMTPPDKLPNNITFLMPNDRTLSETTIVELPGSEPDPDADESSVVDFVLRHSIPSTLFFNHLNHIPTNSVLPSSEPGYMIQIINGGRRDFFFNNVKLTTPNICVSGFSIRCHGVDSVLSPVEARPTLAPYPAAAASGPCSSSSTSTSAAAEGPVGQQAGTNSTSTSSSPPSPVLIGGAPDSTPKQSGVSSVGAAGGGLYLAALVMLSVTMMIINSN